MTPPASAPTGPPTAAPIAAPAAAPPADPAPVPRGWDPGSPVIGSGFVLSCTSGSSMVVFFISPPDGGEEQYAYRARKSRDACRTSVREPRAGRGTIHENFSAGVGP